MAKQGQARKRYLSDLTDGIRSEEAQEVIVLARS